MSPPAQNTPRFRRLLFRLALAGGLLIILGGLAIWEVNRIVQSQPAEPPPQLARSGFDLAGQIVNSSGLPISHARITMHVTDESDGSAIHTDENGQFHISVASGGNVQLLITARGYAAQMRNVQVDAASKPIQVVLSPGLGLNGQVVDAGGKPLPDAMVLLIWEPFGFERPYIKTTTDAEGKFHLVDLPAEEVELEVLKEGFETAELPFTPPLTDKLVTLKPQEIPKISGHVTDAITHQPIARFEIMSGALWKNSTRPNFHGITSFTNGIYDFKLNGVGGEIQGYYVRIEADGYLPLISPPIRQSGAQDFSLQPAPAWKGRVILPDGSPAVGTQIALIEDDPVIFQDGKLIVNIILHFRPMIAGANGSFDLRQQIDPFELWAWSDAGVAHLQRDKPSGENLEMKLTPWASLRLKIPWIAQSKSDLSVVVKSPADLIQRHWTYTVAPDADGSVLLTKLPPLEEGITEVQLARTKPQWEAGPAVLAHLTPGQTTELDLTQGITVTGHVAGDSPFLILSPLADKPAAQWPTDSVAAAELMPPVLDYAAKCDSSGRFVIPAVRPGKYVYNAWADQSPSAPQGNGVVTISADNGATVDVREIPTSKIIAVKEGQPAPSQLGRTLDEKPILTADYRGKFVVCVIWDSLARSAPALPHLAELAAKFGGDKRVELLAINADVQIGGDFRRPPTLGQGWINGYFSMLDAASFEAMANSKNWPPILIIGPDGTVAADDLSSEETAAKLTELLKAQSH